jgi:hypothetical protein
MNIPIYHYKYRCWKCNKEIEIFFPESLSFKYNLGNVKNVYSKTMRSYTIGNICNHCSCYQVNWFINDYILKAIYKSDFLDSTEQPFP